jgi:acyl-CoA thioesterase-2
MNANFDFHALLQPEQHGEYEFVGQSLPTEDSPAIYGGQLIAQVLGVAARTLPEARSAHYLQTCFLAFGDPAGELAFSVTPSRDGRSTSHRVIEVSQAGRILMTATASFQSGAEGYDHQVERPDVQLPEELARDADNYIEWAGPDDDFPFLIIEQPGNSGPESNVWARPRTEVEGDALLHQMLFAFLSDATILQSALQPHDWLLMHSRSPSTGAGRALSVADVFDSSGNLLATVAQEGIMRRRSP